MKCEKCGTELSFGTKFCPECGNKVRTEKKTIQLKCKACGGTLTVDEDMPVLVCPFCKSAELIDESDEVTIQRIKSKAYKDVEFEKLRHETEREQRQFEREQEREQEAEAKRRAYDGKHTRLANFCLFLSVVCLTSTVNSFTSDNFNYLAGIITGIQTILFFLAWLNGRRNSYGKTNNTHKLFATFGFLCFALWSVINANDLLLPFNRRDIIPSITADSVTDEDEGIYSYPVHNYVGKNAASIGRIYGHYRIDEYGSGDLKVIFVTEDGIFIDPNNEDQLKQYIVVAQNLAPTDHVITVSGRWSNGKPTSSVDYQNYEEIILYVNKIDSDAEVTPFIMQTNPSTSRRTHYVRDYVGRNAASIGREYGRDRIDQYCHGELTIEFTTRDGTYVDFMDVITLRQYVVVDQDIAPNTELTYAYSTWSNGSETDSVDYQNYETITLTVEKLDDDVISMMPVMTPEPTAEPEPERAQFELEYEVDQDDNAIITGYTGTGDYLYLPTSIDGHEIIRIDDSAFKDCVTLTAITIWGSPEIGDYAFAGCTGLTEVSIPNDTEAIGDHAFENCTGLKSVIFWDAGNIGEYAFAGCTSLTSVSIPSDTKKIGAHAFDGCTGITELVIWDAEVIGEYAFAGCINIDSVSIPHDVKSIEAHAFDGCINLASTIIWDDDTDVHRDAFSNCPKLNSDSSAKDEGTTEKSTTDPTAAPTAAPTNTPEPTAALTPSPTVAATPTPSPSPTPTQKPTPSPTPDMVYQKGLKGDEVKHIQEQLIALGYLSGAADGDFGNMTMNAVIAFQEANGLDGTGVVTWAEIQLMDSGKAKAKPTPSPTPYSSKYDLALVRRAGSYSIYYLIDFDGKKARYFTSDDTAVQVGKVSGSMDSGLKITYSYWGETWSEKLTYSSGKSKVTVVDGNGFDWDFTVTDIQSVEKILNQPGYHDMK